jgi:hypothetical protein
MVLATIITIIGCQTQEQRKYSMNDLIKQGKAIRIPSTGEYYIKQ